MCSDGSYYTGITNDLANRFTEHQNGHKENSYTYKRRPVKLVFSHEFSSPSQAIAFEKQIKGWRRAKKEALINNEWEKLPELSVSSGSLVVLRQAQDDRQALDESQVQKTMKNL